MRKCLAASMFVAPLVAYACGSFDAAPNGAVGGNLDAAADDAADAVRTSDGAADGDGATDSAAPVDESCAGMTATWDLSTYPPPAIFAPSDGLVDGSTDFQTLREDGGPFGRFLLRFVADDAGHAAGSQFSVSYTPGTAYACVSARVRTTAMLPAPLDFQALSTVNLTASGGAAAGVLVVDEQGLVPEVLFAAGDSGAYTPSALDSGLAPTSWHVIKLEAFAAGPTAFALSLSIDGALYFDHHPMTPSGEVTTAAALVFGPRSEVRNAGAVNAVVDFADVRVDVRP